MNERSRPARRLPDDHPAPSIAEGGGVTQHFGVGVEGAADFFFGRPLDENPYARRSDSWTSWREGWLAASFCEESRGDDERRRWWRSAA